VAVAPCHERLPGAAAPRLDRGLARRSCGCTRLAVLSDFIVASETAVFAVPEVTRGIFPGIGGTQRLPRILRGLHLDGAATARVPHPPTLLRRRHPHRLGEGLSGRVSIALY